MVRGVVDVGVGAGADTTASVYASACAVIRVVAGFRQIHKWSNRDRHGRVLVGEIDIHRVSRVDSGRVVLSLQFVGRPQFWLVPVVIITVR